MKIAVDIDKTLVDCNSFLYEIINSNLSDQDGTKKLRYFEVIDKNPNRRGIISRISRMYKEKYYTLCDNSNEIINELYSQGHEIILLSSRPKGKSLVSSLIRCINQFNIKFSSMVVACNNKIDYCKENNVGILIDNSYVTCVNASKKGVKSIYYMNAEISSLEENENLIICRTWNEIRNKVKEITKTISNKKR